MVEARFQLTCPGCEHEFLVSMSQSGEVIACPECAGWIDVPDVRDLSPIAENEKLSAEYDRQQEEYDRQQAISKRQIEEAERQQTESRSQLEVARLHMEAQHQLSVEQNRRWNLAIERLNGVVDRWDRLADKVELLLARIQEPK